MKNRVREFRKLRGWTVDQLAERTGLSKSQISRIENDKRGWSVDSLNVIAETLGVTVAQLLATSDAWQDVPIFGVIGDGAIVTSRDAKEAEHIKVPAAYGDVLALRVETDSLYPRYLRGENLLCATQPACIRDVFGKECLIYLPNGRALVRIIHAGSRARVYNLTSHNQPPLTDMAIVSCRPVLRF